MQLFWEEDNQNLKKVPSDYYPPPIMFKFVQTELKVNFCLSLFMISSCIYTADKVSPKKQDFPDFPRWSPFSSSHHLFHHIYFNLHGQLNLHLCICVCSYSQATFYLFCCLQNSHSFQSEHTIWISNREVKLIKKRGILHIYLPSSSDTSLKVLSSNTERGSPLTWVLVWGALLLRAPLTSSGCKVSTTACPSCLLLL